MSQTIYAADDEQDILDVMREFLENAGFEVRTFPTGDALFAAFLERPCDLVVLDVMMPGTDGLSICKQLRAISTVPIIILTAKDSEIDHIRGYMQGGDEYLTKPFSPTLLVVRINALLRRVNMSGGEGLAGGGDGAQAAAKAPDDQSFGDVCVSQRAHAVLCGGRDIGLTNTEFSLFTYLFQSPGTAFSRDELLREVWDAGAGCIETRVTDETVRRIRRKLRDAGSSVRIVAVWGFGYKLEGARDEADEH